MARAQALLQRSAQEGEERRKTITHQNEQEPWGAVMRGRADIVGILHQQQTPIQAGEYFSIWCSSPAAEGTPSIAGSDSHQHVL